MKNALVEVMIFHAFEIVRIGNNAELIKTKVATISTKLKIKQFQETLHKASTFWIIFFWNNFLAHFHFNFNLYTISRAFSLPFYKSPLTVGKYGQCNKPWSNNQPSIIHRLVELQTIFQRYCICLPELIIKLVLRYICLPL